ncbi:hypothetical protein HSBAA_66460 [Vreelandella sulfidaeris]|uniref:Cation efflux protein cytoplasmic domain-containing protein n=1 Tax=Vreelandella sulfidaeris TaxID=115553 RepID=A0A455UGH1_9GAMM|nr:hypothetical protein HSBAA_66460 [Halomonas sulfidaeris]
MTQTIETPVVHDQERLSQEAKRVTYIGAWLDALLSIVKVTIGFMVGSAALIADGIHSPIRFSHRRFCAGGDSLRASGTR